MNDYEGNVSDVKILESLRSDVAIPSSDVQRRVSSRLALSIGAMSGPSGQADHPTGDLRPWFTRALGRRFALTLAFGLGGASGAGVYAALERPAEPRIVYVNLPPNAAEVSHADPIPTGTSSQATPAEPQSGSAGVSAPPSMPLRQVTGSATAAPSERGGLAGLAAQQVLLDAARSALNRGDKQAALQALNAHVARFPTSVLSEEREALTIKTLVSLGRFADAKARGARFQEQFPHSLLLPSVNETLATIP
jgi:hypothetical protein